MKCPGEVSILFITTELEEAIFLADRILIMTFLPGRIKTVIAVDLPRPRDYRVLTSKRYLEIKGETLECLLEEGRKCFGDVGQESPFPAPSGGLC